MIENGDFRSGTSGWDSSANMTVVTSTSAAPQLDTHAAQIAGSYTSAKRVSQTVYVNGAAGDTLYFTYDASGRPLSVALNGTTYYYATNLQGDVTAILNSSGTAVVNYTYNAWGNPITTTGTQATTLGTLNPLRYRGYVYDTETGLYYLQSRYFDSEVGRFLNADTFTSTGQGILGNNMFAYCNNNSVVYADYSGLSPHEKIEHQLLL